MSIDYKTPIEGITLRYIITHCFVDLRKFLEDAFANVAANYYDIDDIRGIFQMDIDSTNQRVGRELSRAAIQISDMPYDSVELFEEVFSSYTEIFGTCKTYDSFKIQENRYFLKELYNIEMMIREIYTVLTCLQNANIKNSKVRVLKEYLDNEDTIKKSLMNELFFIGFSDYKNLDARKKANFDSFWESLIQVEKLEDIMSIIANFSNSTLELEERFNELSRIPEAIGRLESFRNCIAHNRYPSSDDVSNFEFAKSLIGEIYQIFRTKLQACEL